MEIPSIKKIMQMERWERVLIIAVAALVILVAINFLVIGSGPHYASYSGGASGGDPSSTAGAGGGGLYLHP